jgi:hypothetical protein
MSAFNPNISKSDHNIIRDYVTAMDHMQYTQLPEGVVCVNLTHSNLPTKHLDVCASHSFFCVLCSQSLFIVGTSTFDLLRFAWIST